MAIWQLQTIKVLNNVDIERIFIFRVLQPFELSIFQPLILYTDAKKGKYVAKKSRNHDDRIVASLPMENTLTWPF